MTAYRFTQRYRSSYGEGNEGDVVTLSDQQAADINRDAPGTLEPADAPTARAVKDAPKDRQVKAASNRQAPIDKTTFKAVRDKA